MTYQARLEMDFTLLEEPLWDVYYVYSHREDQHMLLVPCHGATVQTSISRAACLGVEARSKARYRWLY